MRNQIASTLFSQTKQSDSLHTLNNNTSHDSQDLRQSKDRKLMRQLNSQNYESVSSKGQYNSSVAM